MIQKSRMDTEATPCGNGGDKDVSRPRHPSDRDVGHSGGGGASQSPNGSPAVLVADNYVELRGLRISSPDVLTFFKETDEPDRVRQAIRSVEIGAMVIARVTASNDMDFVKTRVTEMVAGFDERLRSFRDTIEQTVREKFDPDVANSFIAKSNRILLTGAESLHKTMDSLLKSAEARVGNMYQTAEGRLGQYSKDAEGRLVSRLSEIDQRRVQMEKDFDPGNKAGYLGKVIGAIEEFERMVNEQFSETDRASFVGKLNACVDEFFG